MSTELWGGSNMRPITQTSVMRIFAISLAFGGVTACSSMHTERQATAMDSFAANEPFAISAGRSDTVLGRVLTEATFDEFGKYLKVSKEGNGKGRIEVLFETQTLANGVVSWQNATALVTISSQDGNTLWSSEYNYKGGWEASGFSTNTPAEAAHLVMRRIADQFASEYKLR